MELAIKISWKTAHPKLFPTLMGSDTCPMGPCHMLLTVVEA